MRLVRNYIRRVVAEVLAEQGLVQDWRAQLALQGQVDAAVDQATVVYDAGARRKDGPKGDLRMLGATPKSPPTPKSQPGRKRRG